MDVSFILVQQQHPIQTKNRFSLFISLIIQYLPQQLQTFLSLQPLSTLVSQHSHSPQKYTYNNSDESVNEGVFYLNKLGNLINSAEQIPDIHSSVRYERFRRQWEVKWIRYGVMTSLLNVVKN